MRRNSSERRLKVCNQYQYHYCSDDKRPNYLLALSAFIRSIFYNFPLLCIAGNLEPYYDDEGEPIVDTDEIDSEEEIIMIGNKTSRDYEYHD